MANRKVNEPTDSTTAGLTNKQYDQWIKAKQLQSILDTICHIVDKSVKWIGWLLVGIFVILPALKTILSAPPDKITALGGIIKNLISGDSADSCWLLWIIAAIMCGAVVVLIVVCLVLKNANNRHIEKIDVLRTQLEANDPGGRTTSGLNM